jgi:branched-chain amino acid transport system permease protein
MAIIGGLGSIPGALLGAAYLTFLNNSSFTRTPSAQFLGSGVGVLFVLMVLPGGLGGLLYEIRDSLLRRLAKARGIVVPSLLADVRVEAAPDDASLGDVEVESLDTIELETVHP